MQTNTICFINQKGGCGKSSSCFHLAGYFAKLGMRVLVIDADPQGSLSQGFFGSATIENLPGPNQVLRENTKRRIVIQSNVAGRDLGSVVGDMQDRVKAQVQLPQGYFLEYGGQFEAQQRSTRTLSILTIFSLIAIFFILLKALGDWRAAVH